MSRRRLTKQEALKLVTSVIDGEVDGKTKKAFFRYIDQDLYVRRQYESAKRIKDLISERCPVVKAPDHLKQRITQTLAAERSLQASPTCTEPVYDIQCSKTPCSYSTESNPEMHLPVSDTRRVFQNWHFMSGVMVLISILLGSVAYYAQSSSPSYSVEEYAYRYFAQNNGDYIQPTIATTDMTSAEAELASNYNLPIIVPPLINAEFKGVVYTDFLPDFKAPLIEYYIPQDDQYVYVFAFNSNSLYSNAHISFSQEAINNCVGPDDFYIRQVNGKFVVSWKWNDTWYAAVSNQDGKKLASLVKPLADKLIIPEDSER